MNENKAKVWLARQQSGSLRLYTQKPKKEINGWTSNSSSLLIYMYSFPSVKWEDDEPTEAYITLAEPQEQPKHEIDWEQRRYDIVKEMIVRKWLSDIIISEGQFPYSEYDDIASAIKYADRVINKLKKQSDA